MKKNLKLGLAGCLTYTILGITSPIISGAYGSLNSSIDTSSIITGLPSESEKLKTDYEKELYYATKDTKLTSPEIEKLDNLLTKYLESKNKQQIINEQEQTTDNKTVTIESIIQEFEKNILIYYPHISSEKTTLKYDAFQKLSEKENLELKSLINQAYNLTENIILESLINKEIYEVRDLVLFCDILKLYTESQKKPEPENNKMKVESLENSQVLIEKLNLSDEQFVFIKSVYDTYLEARDKELVEDKKYWCPGVIGLDKDESTSNEYLTDEIKRGLIKSLGIQGYWNIKISNFYENVGFKGKFPQIPNWAMLTFGIVFPFFRNYLSSRIVRRQYDAFDFGEGFISLFMGGLFLDALHPLVYPIRVFGVPFVYEPLRRVLGARNI